MDINVNLSKEDKIKIKNSSRAKKIRERLRCGFKSLFKSPIKGSIALIYIIMALILWSEMWGFVDYQYENAVLRMIQSVITEISPELYHGIFIYGFPVLALFGFLLLIGILGVPIHWGGKFENACISSGIYTKAWKSPFLLEILRIEGDPNVRVWIAFGNGNDIEEFRTKWKKLESELGIKIYDMEEFGVQKIRLFVYPDRKSHQRINRDDKNY
ncbi:MAG: hypothetical protein FWH14_01640 [Oscillospiraceae bacterium]|nr:hypothetical protein [Oscillospiraceae bacterium]